MSTFINDVRYAFRNLRSNTGFTAVAVAALALGIGANTAIFTVVDGVMLAPLPYKDADRLVRLGRKFPAGNGYSNSIPKYMVWRKNDVFQAITLYEQGGIGLKNVKRRLDILYGVGYTLQLDKMDDVFKVQLKIPLS